ncbi:unnamed protein product [Caenorhabditis angaria]|uniref:IBR domain-containing protein n=1 Tax=Caenorhabditis angaria TaxID=860376 RepID=A0A9P1IU08_9PELO|nr:unnamed protein product [Caenorhabditis angaria]
MSACETCRKTDDVKIILRQCGHIICLPCILDYLKHKIILEGEPRIKCLKVDCMQPIHQNDINAVLDEKEAALEHYMSIDNRRYLQFKQNKHSIYKALPTDEIKRCPLCRSIYMKEPGCHFVTCANSACGLAFCWTCEKPVPRPVSHFTGLKARACRLGYLDYERLLNCLRYVLDINFIALWAFLPVVYFLAYLFIPIAIFFTIPISIIYEIWRDAKVSRTFWIALIPLMMKSILSLIFALLLSIPVTFGSILMGFFVSGFYGMYCMLKSVPFLCSGNRIGTILCVMRWCGRIFRIGPYGQLLDEARANQKAAILKMEDQLDDFENAVQDDVESTTKIEKETETSKISKK